MIGNKKILAVIPARGGSKGIKLKNLCKLKDRTLTELAIRVAQKVDIIDEIVVSTDHPLIVEEAIRCGISVPFLRPSHLSGDLISDIDVLSNALVESELAYDTTFDIVVMLQPTSPLRSTKNVCDAIQALDFNGLSSIWSISETDTKSHPLKQLTLEGDRLKYYDSAGSNIIARQQLNSTYHRNGVVYAFTRECILDERNKMGTECGYLLVNDFNLSIDTLKDIELIKFHISTGSVSAEAAVFL